MSRDSDVLTTLRTLDPAASAVSSDSPRARADLARILVSSRTATDDVTTTARPVSRRRPMRRLAMMAATVTGATALVTLAPSLNGGDAAFATWTATPRALGPAEAKDAAEACREQQKDGAAAEQSAALAAARAVISEARGAWTTVVLAGTDGLRALCVTDESTRLFGSSFGSFAPAGQPAVAAQEIRLVDLGVGSIDGNPLSLAGGHAGDQVAAVSYRSRSGGTVAATVSGGHFALWLPGDELEDAPRDGIALEIEYADGTSRTVTARL